MCRRESKSVQGPWISRLGKGKGMSGKQVLLELCADPMLQGGFFADRKALCRRCFPAGFGGNRNACGGTCSAHVACAFVFLYAAEVYTIACSLCMSAWRRLCFVWIEQQSKRHCKFNERRQKGEITSWAVWKKAVMLSDSIENGSAEALGELFANNTKKKSKHVCICVHIRSAVRCENGKEEVRLEN